MDWMSFRTLTEAFQGYIADGLSPEIKNKTKTKKTKTKTLLLHSQRFEDSA